MVSSISSSRSREKALGGLWIGRKMGYFRLGATWATVLSYQLYSFAIAQVCVVKKGDAQMGRDAFPVVFDGHNDVLLRLGGPDGVGPGAFFERGDQGHLDLPRAREGPRGQLIPCWIPSPGGQRIPGRGGFHPHSMPRTRCTERWPILPCYSGSRISRTGGSESSRHRR